MRLSIKGTHLDDQKLERHAMNAANVVVEVEDMNKMGIVGIELLLRNSFCIDLRKLVQVNHGVFA